MPFWVAPYKIRRSTRILSYAVKQNWDLLEMGGEICYVMKRFVRSNAPFTVTSRRVDTVSKSINSLQADPLYSIDPG